jgi:hypothetical protein
VPEDAFDELTFVRQSAFHTNSERKTVIIGESDDFRPFAALGRPDREAPFFAPMKESSMKVSFSCNFPRACNSSASTRKMSSRLPSRTHCWKRRWQVWYGGYFLGNEQPKPFVWTKSADAILNSIARFASRTLVAPGANNM